MNRLETFFGFKEQGTDLVTEVRGGLTTFMTMAYIIIVNPGILSAAGMDRNSVMMATCLASALATIVMGLWARYPIALAPGMGLNAFFAFEICGSQHAPWPVALGMVFISGVLFLGLSFLRVRTMLIGVIPDSLKHSIAAGIGLFIAFIGLQHAGLVVHDEQTLVRLGDLTSAPVLISLASLAAVGAMMAAGVRGAVLWGILLAGGLGILFGKIPPPTAVVSLPPSMSPTFLKLDVLGVFSNWRWVASCFVFLFFVLFDTVGTLVGVSTQAGLMKDGNLPRATQAFASDATGTIIGSLFGTSTVTSYIESAAGVAAGARTGLANLVTAALFVAAIFFAPLVSTLAVGMVTAPALIVVGCMMMASVARVKWDDMTEALPAFLTMLLMPLTFSISRGLVAGFISWPLLQLAAGRGRQVHPFLYIMAAILAAGVIGAYLFM